MFPLDSVVARDAGAGYFAAMKSHVIEAILDDPTHLTLRCPVNLPIGSALRVVLSTQDDDREVFLQASAALLGQAYGPDEPEYTEADIKEFNPDFRP